MDAIILKYKDTSMGQPITCTRDYGECTVGNKTLRERISSQIKLHDLNLIDKETENNNDLRLYVYDNSYLGLHFKDIDMSRPQLLTSIEKQVLGCITTNINTLPESKTIIEDAFSILYPWDLLKANKQILDSIEKNELSGSVAQNCTINGNIILGADSNLLPGVFIEGNIVIGKNCKIGPNCYLRGGTSIGDNCHIGQAVEIKNSIIMQNSSIGHLSYVGDSVIGSNVNMGAGTITSNLRHDGKNHKSVVNEKLIETGRRKLGTILGDNVHTGIHCGFYPARKMWPGKATLPGEIVKKDIK
ncbi:MAG: DapH/DapD/GlmU-related protein [Verrucomicrobiota bacterium]|nr:DapH/DapD/GlmU-related protein [Verrucomicrobiota bacterium]